MVEPKIAIYCKNIRIGGSVRDRHTYNIIYKYKNNNKIEECSRDGRIKKYTNKR